jgi:hypothetical protein
MRSSAESRSLRFKERMKGHIAFDRLGDLVVNTVDGTGWVAMDLEFRMRIDDVDRFWNGDHVGQLDGDIVCKELGGACTVSDGHFQLMIPVGNDVRHQHMLYYARFTNTAGRQLTLDGYKEVITGEFDPLEDTTAMLTRIHDGWSNESDTWSPDAIATGILRISVIDTVTQLFTFRSDGVSPARATRTILTFIWRFTRSLWTVYGIERRRRRATPAQ